MAMTLEHRRNLENTGDNSSSDQNSCWGSGDKKTIFVFHKKAGELNLFSSFLSR